MESLRVFVGLLLCLLVPSSRSYHFTHRKVSPSVLKPTSSENETTSYVVIFDDGSTGTRVHVFKFNQSLDLLPIDGDDYEYYYKVTPGLSSYADDPEEAAETLIPLLRKAESVVPESFRSTTPLRLGATAGMRTLQENVSALILEAVRDVLESNSTFEVDSVAILSGIQEGSYLWVAVNYLLNNSGVDYTKTVGAVDLGGGSVQMAYAISEADAAVAPNSPEGEDPYVTQIYLGGTKYYLYVHSYLHFGKEASRAEILKVTGDSDNPCILAGYNGTYEYGDVEYKASALSSGSSFSECRNTILEALNVNATCAYKNCTFGGSWNGGGGPGQETLYLATNFYYLAVEAGFANENETSSEVRIIDYKISAELACKTTYEEANTTFPDADEDSLPYICLDLVYQYTLLTDGFGLDPWKVVTVVNELKYGNSSLDASWALGSAIEVISSSSNFERFMYVV